MSNHKDNRSAIPSVDRVLTQSPSLVETWGHQAVSQCVRQVVQSLRHEISLGRTVDCRLERIQAAVDATLSDSHRAGLRPVINLSGVVLHTNLGRACLPESAAEAARLAAINPTNLEFDLATGRRGNRDSHVEALICELTGCEAATVVNNNAAAVVLVLNTLAKGQEVPVSRGELVEIGGSFRMPEVMASSGCTLVEVGATNRTHVKDYRSAISPNTGLLMKVHTSNYRIDGFTQAVDEKALAQLAHEHDLPFVLDLGSGCLVDFAALGLPSEPIVADYIRDGADLITFSGDKLLGGPQCGIIAGKKSLIQAVCNNPLKRALRQDAMTIAALAEVLKLYRHPEKLLRELPTLRQLTRPLASIETQAHRLCAALSDCLAAHFKVSVQSCFSQVGSGALPVETIASCAVAIESVHKRDSDLRYLSAQLRQLPLPVVGRFHEGALLLDCRGLENETPLLGQLPQLVSRMAALPSC